MSCYTALFFFTNFDKKDLTTSFGEAQDKSNRAVKRTGNLKTKAPVKLIFSRFFFGADGGSILVFMRKASPKFSVRNPFANTFGEKETVVVLHTNICYTTK